jgi:hypothetical protein
MARRAQMGALVFRAFGRDMALPRRAIVVEPDAAHRPAQHRGLLALAVSILYLSQFRAGLIEARVQSLLVQGEIIAGAIAASATVETDAITIDPDRLLELQTGESYGPIDEAQSALEFPINPERVAPLLRRLVLPTRTQARVYDREARCCSTRATSTPRRRAALRPDPGRRSAEPHGARLDRDEELVRARQPAALPRPRAGERQGYPEVLQACSGLKSSTVRVNERGEIIVLVAVPIQRFRAVRGALLLSTEGGEIDSRSRPSGCRSSCCSSRSGRDGAALDAARAHHRGTGAPAGGRCRERAAPDQGARRESRTSPGGATRSANCPARCAR